jgi:hypothetical protein
MKLRKLLFVIPLFVVPSASFQPTYALFPSPSKSVPRQLERRNSDSTVATKPSGSKRRIISSPSPSSLKASTVVPPTSPLLSNGVRQPHQLQQHQQQSPVRHNNNNKQSSTSSSSSSPSHGLFRPKRQELIVDDAAYQRRKEEWARKYTSVDALRDTFGASRNGVLGDLDPQTSRRLYKTLLPKALLELYKMGVHPEDLAPLAYRARVAAKLYARERCSLPFRVAANLYDGFRQWRRYGSFDTHGMSFQQIWEKYSAVILEQSESEDLTPEDATAQICLKILERSCATNDFVDNMFLRDEEGKQDLEHFTQTLEQDVRRLLQPVKEVTKPSEQELHRFRTLRRVARIKRRLNMSLHRNSGKADAAPSGARGSDHGADHQARPRFPRFGGARQ